MLLIYLFIFVSSFLEELLQQLAALVSENAAGNFDTVI